jgi:hypothetical protein
LLIAFLTKKALRENNAARISLKLSRGEKTGRMKLLICCALWGDWHTRVFTEKALPTLLHDSNLPAMSRKLDVEWIFYTHKHEHDRIYPLVERMGVKTGIVQIQLQNGYKTAWRYGKYESDKRDGIAMFLAPDIVWSKGSFDHIADLILAGKRLIFMTHPRGIEDTFSGEPKTGRELMGTCFEHMHPVNSSEIVGGRPFTKHPEMILWKLKCGYLARMFAREPLISPPEMEFNEVNLPAFEIDEDKRAVVLSSDDACGVSLAPLETEQHHYKHGNTFNVDAIRAFLKKNRSSQGKWLASQPVLWRGGEVDKHELMITTKQSQQIVAEAFG